VVTRWDRTHPERLAAWQAGNEVEAKRVRTGLGGEMDVSPAVSVEIEGRDPLCSPGEAESQQEAWVTTSERQHEQEETALP
jgi:hypothetical protein